MKKRSLLFPVIALLWAAACSEPDHIDYVTFRLNEPFTFTCCKIFKEDADQPLGITIHGLILDSRCPANISCPDPGLFKAPIRCYNNLVTVDDTLRIGGLNSPLTADSMVADGYIIKITSVNPYPNGSDFIVPHDYQMQMVVRRQ